MIHRMFGSAQRAETTRSRTEGETSSPNAQPGLQDDDMPDDGLEGGVQVTASGERSAVDASVARTSFVPNFRGRESLEGFSAAELNNLPQEMKNLVSTQGIEGEASLAGAALESLSKGLRGQVRTGTFQALQTGNILPRELSRELSTGPPRAQDPGSEGAALGQQRVCLHCHHSLRQDQVRAAFHGTCAEGCVSCHKKCLSMGPQSLLAPFATSPGMLTPGGNVVLSHPGLQAWLAIVDGDGMARVYASGLGVRCSLCVLSGQTPGRRRLVTDLGAEVVGSEDNESLNSRDDLLVEGADPGTLIDGHGGRNLGAAQELGRRMIRLLDLEYSGTPDAERVEDLEGMLNDSAIESVTLLLAAEVGLNPETGAFPGVVDWAKVQDTLLQLVTYQTEAGAPEPVVEVVEHTSDIALCKGLRTLHTLLDPDGPPAEEYMGMLRRFMGRAPPELVEILVAVVGWDSGRGSFASPDRWPHLLRALRAAAVVVGGEPTWFEARAAAPPPPPRPLNVAPPRPVFASRLVALLEAEGPPAQGTGSGVASVVRPVSGSRVPPGPSVPQNVAGPG
eukprot:CAMPEP_0181306134 /NCGR_PEP_ID=MMETSP1101-20121128/10125_1 /TAXON_ID=46948 /ORGANISM="Rhodomonas abbreviata, Strain Caron Lab Isolate" /LENGTH=562 /DNA_ID=CAMNT_0023412145 /DNA_START=1455 /DNA_END=3140 /DNA_ORIENTATION=-